ncbi:hypothetical protein [Synechococcus elongatus]|uniref:hypothetical protein n=1 Tax=Synechococcus elongatus TaxID=32046 RepID=UPI0030D1EF13
MFRACLCLLLLLGLLFPRSAAAAEVLSVRQGGLLRIGDSNRSYTVQIDCVQPIVGQEVALRDRLQALLPRRTRVNLRPNGLDQEGRVVATVYRLPDGLNVGEQLQQEQLATLSDQCASATVSQR